MSDHSAVGDRNGDDNDPWRELGSAKFYLDLPEYITRQPVGDTATPDGCAVPDAPDQSRDAKSG